MAFPERVIMLRSVPKPTRAGHGDAMDCTVGGLECRPARQAGKVSFGPGHVAALRRDPHLIGNIC
jgi:hypothetical protein